MRQQEHDAIHPVPFLFRTGNELVDHDLTAVHEIAKLRFPQYQRVRIR
jgi:hypothetical protein